MKLAVTFVAALSLSGCSEDRTNRLPVTPSPPPVPPTSTAVIASVIDQNGSCIVGATLQVVAGQATGKSMVQTQPCAYWDYGHELIFSNLVPGLALTLRATAPGYTTVDRAVVPSATRVDLTLSRLAPVD